MRIDFARIDLVGVDFVRIDLVAPNRQEYCKRSDTRGVEGLGTGLRILYNPEKGNVKVPLLTN